MSESAIVLLPGRSSVLDQEDAAIRKQFPGEVIEYQRIDFGDAKTYVEFCQKNAHVCILLIDSVYVPQRAFNYPELIHAVFVPESNQIERVLAVAVTYETEPMETQNPNHLVSG